MNDKSPGESEEDFKVLIVYPNLPLMLVPSLAIALFMRIFKDLGYRVEIFETTHYVSDQMANADNRQKRLQARSFDVTKDIGITMKTDLLGDFRRKVEEFAPDFMIYSVVEDAFMQCVGLLDSIADLGIPHLIGGVFPTNAPGRCFDFPAVKMIGRGEGEHTVAAVAEAVRLGGPLHDIPGTWYRDDDGHIHRNGQPPLADLDQVRPDFSLYEENRFYRPMGGRMFKMVPVETYRGCPYACTYCNSPAQRTFAKSEGLGNFLRRKTMSVLRDELAETIERTQAEFIFFIDDSFLARPKGEIFQFCDMYEEFGLPFWFNTRAENFTPDVLERLKEVGCYRMSASIESGNEEYREKVLRRKVSNAKLIERFGLVSESGIAFSMDVIVGSPGETRELVMDSVELIRSIKGYDALTVSVFTPYHGTVLREVAVNNGWVDRDSICTQGYARSILKMPRPHMNATEIEGLTAVFPLYCHFPKSAWDDLRRAEMNDEEGLKIREHYAETYQEEFFSMDQEQKLAMHAEDFGGISTGCRTNPQDAFRVSPKRLSDEELTMLTEAAE